jgi:hypothetical protein
MWKLKWREDADEKYQITQSVHSAIVHSIEGLDPHNPIFERNKCYRWKLWNCMVIRDTKDESDEQKQLHIYLKTPLTSSKSGRTQNLKKLLAYHYFGDVAEPMTSSRSPCPCGSGKTYGSCCFPTIHSVCHIHTGIRNCGLCVNPMHFMSGKNSDDEPGSDCPYSEPVIRKCTPCSKCNWNPYIFPVTDRVNGYHEQPCMNDISLEPYTSNTLNTLFSKWKHESIKNHLDLIESNPTIEENIILKQQCINTRLYLSVVFSDMISNIYIHHR